jgi:hypothetical protein
MSTTELDKTFNEIRGRINSDLDLKALEMSKAEIANKRSYLVVKQYV